MKKILFALLVAFTGLGTATPAAAAVDGCKVLLCLAGDWKHIGECVPPVREALRDAALGRGWPSCSMSAGGGAGTTSARETPTDETTCPPMYSNYMVDEQSQHFVGCAYAGLVVVKVGGQVWSTTFWDMGGNSVTAFSDAAKAQLGAGNYDMQYDTDLAAWNASHPPTPSPPVDGDCPGGNGCSER